MTNPAEPAATKFQGTIGRTFAESTPYFPDPPEPSGKPNVVVVLLDDLGWSDFGCFGSEIETPTVDRIASEGLRYTNFHVTALCSPTRASLLTGLNHHSAGMGMVPNFRMGYPSYQGFLHHNAATLGEMLQGHGYTTFGVGKWHLTPMSEFTGAGPFDQWPVQRGFNRYYGTPDGWTNQWRPDLIEDNHRLPTPQEDGYHFSTDIVDQAIGMVRDHRAGSEHRPFFLYMSFCAPHWPHHVPREYVDKYVPVFEKGWDQTRQDRLERQKQLGVVAETLELPPRNPGVNAWDDYDEEAKRAMVRLQAAYAGMVDHADEQIGRFVAALEETGDFDNTIFVVLSDNGASQEGGEVGTLDAMRFMRGFKTDEELAEIGPNLDSIGGPEWTNNYALGWAMASNTPLKRWKQDTHGGGLRSPLVIRYGPQVQDPGGIRTQFHHITDLVPTLLDMAGLDAPATHNGVELQPVQGQSFRYTLSDAGAGTTKTAQYFEMAGHRAIWKDGWKAVSYHTPVITPLLVFTGQAANVTDFEADVWELYHLDEDWNEVHNLAEKEPERLAAMIQAWWDEAEKYDVFPLGALVNGMRMPARPAPPSA